MEVIGEKEAMRRWSRARRVEEGKRIALVPTMGFLHEGHLSLIREAKRLADVVVVSIYVNPSQFGPSEDLSIYPRDFQGDLLKLQPYSVDAVFHPYDLYIRDSLPLKATEEGIQDLGTLDISSQIPSRCSQGHETWINVEKLAKPLCGKSRPMFFKGVATVVAKLFNIIEPDIAIFGKKDYQQWRVICRMVRDLDFAVDVVGHELIRELDGLALSSRNVRLSQGERQQALSIYTSLKRAEEMVKNGGVDCLTLKMEVQKIISVAGGKIDYVELMDQVSLEQVERIDYPTVLCVAAWFGNVRLIDNIELQPCSIVS